MDFLFKQTGRNASENLKIPDLKVGRVIEFFFFIKE
jgi:hypothetical protein